MADIHHSFIIHSSPEKIYEKITSADGLSKWWSKSSTGQPKLGEIYKLNFGSGFNWEAKVTKCKKNEEFELTMIKADKDWIKSQIGFLLHLKNGATDVEFYHKGWPDENKHYRISSYCWAMYLRLLKRNIEFGEEVPYEKRLEV